jgi:hypothetical protein
MSRLIIAICEDYIVINTHYDFAISTSCVFNSVSIRYNEIDEAKEIVIRFVRLRRNHKRQFG